MRQDRPQAFMCCVCKGRARGRSFPLCLLFSFRVKYKTHLRFFPFFRTITMGSYPTPAGVLSKECTRRLGCHPGSTGFSWIAPASTRLPRFLPSPADHTAPVFCLLVGPSQNLGSKHPQLVSSVFTQGQGESNSMDSFILARS